MTAIGRKGKKNVHGSLTYEKVDGPKVAPVGTAAGMPLASSVFIHTVFPHQFKLMPPFGRTKVKKMTIKPNATPASRPAERM